MNFFDRLKNGWTIAMLSFKTINENRTLLLFPVVSSVSLIIVLLTFFGGGFLLIGDSIDSLLQDDMMGNIMAYALIFTYYLINYFIIVFFNAALIHCSVKIFNEEPTDLSDGINYATSKIDKIFSWAVLSATVGTVLQAIRNTGRIGEFVAGLMGGAWSILTFFVVPIVIYENKNVIDSVKESTAIMREKWGESLAGSVSFGIFQVLGIIVTLGIFILLVQVNIILGLAAAMMFLLLTFTVVSAARTIFVAAVYNHVKGQPTGNFGEDTLDSVFFSK
ncbi:MAG: DUF6159 family protein [Saprospiraceae bacterium]